MSRKILIVDDSVYMRMTIKTAVEKAGYDVVGEAANGDTAIEMALEHKPDLITLDNVLPDMFGKELLQTLLDEELDTKFIIISAVGQDSLVEKELSMGALDYIVKPFSEEELIKVVDKALKGTGTVKA